MRTGGQSVSVCHACSAGGHCVSPCCVRSQWQGTVCAHLKVKDTMYQPLDDDVHLKVKDTYHSLDDDDDDDDVH